MNELADALTQEAWREVAPMAFARAQKARLTYLRTCLSERAILCVDRLRGDVAPFKRLERDGESALQLQCAALEREVYQ